MVAGAVNRPDEVIEPAPAGEIDHVTAWSEALTTVALSCAVCPLFKVTLGGFMLTATVEAVPLNVMVCSDGSASSVMIIVAL